MNLRSISLQNFRSYRKAEFEFDKDTTVIIGPNTSGKTNLIEAIFYLALGKSFHAEKDDQIIKFGEEIARVKGVVKKGVSEENEIEAVLSIGQFSTRNGVSKKFLVNGVAKRRVDFAENFSAVLFSPEDLDIIVASPSLRRRFLDNVLEQVDREYRLSLTAYTKGIRQRNALLGIAREEGRRNEKQFEYWDNLVIENGEKITKKREEFIEFINTYEKEIFDFACFYDKSIISKARLTQYKDAELASGITLVGPHRDDFSLSMFDDTRRTTHNVKAYGSRGQQRLAILQLKLLELLYIEKELGLRPVLLLDDIFSELDEEHINLVLEMLQKQQTIITTAHKELIPGRIVNRMKVIEFEK
ncbi:MAG TPA: DNA replication and repair protein RecF [Patescibacteria group bacterium]|nr:DNA replication and repair protein RecF [Patescibacteria group bacterium]